MDRIRNVTVRTKLNVETLEEKAKRRKASWKQQLSITDDNRVPKTVYRYKMEGRHSASVKA